MSRIAIVLLGAALVSGVLGEITDTVAILVIILLNAVIGMVQEYRAERALDALKQLAVPSVTVRRDGRPTTIPSEQLVPGDLLLLETGDLVPADVMPSPAGRSPELVGPVDLPVRLPQRHQDRHPRCIRDSPGRWWPALRA